MAEMQGVDSHVDGGIEDKLEVKLSYSTYLFLSIHLFSRGYTWIISS